MALKFTVGSTQYIRHPADASIHDLTQWSVAAWVYTTSIPSSNWADIFKKGHAKRFGIDNGGALNIKQNKVSPLEAAANVITTNQWQFVCGVCNADASSPNEQVFLYTGNLNTVVSEVSSYLVQSNDYVTAIESDITEPQTNTTGDLIVGNAPHRGPWNGNRAFGGYIATVAFWSAAVDISVLKKFQFNPVGSPPPDFNNLELYSHYFKPGPQADLSGKRRTGHTYRGS